MCGSPKPLTHFVHKTDEVKTKWPLTPFGVFEPPLAKGVTILVVSLS
jgi:hypothetical protein